MKTAEKAEINKFMGEWYVLAGRFTFLEKDVHNGLETYSWNQEKERIDVVSLTIKVLFRGLKSLFLKRHGCITKIPKHAGKFPRFGPLNFIT